MLLPKRSRSLTQASMPDRNNPHSFTICFARPDVFRARIAYSRSFAACCFAAVSPTKLMDFAWSTVCRSLSLINFNMNVAASLSSALFPVMLVYVSWFVTSN